MDFHGHILLNDNEMQKMVLQTETDFPTTPVAGRVVFKNSKVWICVEIQAGVLAWVPLTSSVNMYVHEQDTISDTWTVNHNLHTMSPVVQVFDPDTMAQYIPDTIIPSTGDSLTITFTDAVAGRAVVMFGNQSVFYPVE